MSASETQQQQKANENKNENFKKIKMISSVPAAVWALLCMSIVLQTFCGATNISSTVSTTTTSDSGAPIDLDKAESKDSKTSEIIKRIRRVNSDGSYTVGYEADDGTFKIESRDVLGNIKGTYGFVDQNGDIKRVSYTANNDTNLLKSTLAPTEEVVHIPRQNRTQFVSSTTRRPTAISYLATSTMAPSRSNTAQTLPKRRILLSASDRGARKSSPQYATMVRKSELTTAMNRKTEPTTTIVYATSVPHTKMARMTTQMPVSSTTAKPDNAKKSDIIEISDRFSKVLNMNKELASSEKPVFESSDEKETQTERKPLRGNFLRRQLPDGSNEHYEAQQQVVYSSQSSAEVGEHVYGGITGSVRPIFSTTSSPRIPALVLAARSRAALLKNSQQPTTQTTSTTERVYSRPPRRKVERLENGEQTTEPTSENNYLTQSPVAVQIPANRDLSQASEDDQRVYRRPTTYLPRSREYLRQAQQENSLEPGGPRQYRIPIQPTANLPSDYENEQQQYLRETTNPTQNEQYANSEVNAGHASAFGARNPRPYLPQPTTQGAYDPQQQQQSYPLPNPYAPYQRQVPYGPNYYNNPDRPLTARDFERLLNLLVVRHQQYQRYNYLGGPGQINPFGFGGAGNPYAPNAYSPLGAFGGYPGYQQQIPRPPLFNQYDPRYGSYRPPPPPPIPGAPFGPYTEQENMYQAQNPIPEQQQPYAGQRQPARARSYVPNYYGPFGDRTEYGDESQQSYQQATGEYLPSNVREELLYRMLMLAIQPDQAMNSPVPEASTMQEYVKTSATTATPLKSSKKPVRSVQILGEDEE